MGIVNRLWELRTDSRGTHHRKIRVYPMVTADEQWLAEQTKRHGSMKAGTQVHWLWPRVLEGHGYWVVGCSSRRIPRGRVAGRELGEKEQRSLFARRAPSDIDAGQREHQFVSGPFGKLWQSGMEAQELAALGSESFGGVGEKAKVADSHKPARKDMKQEATDELLDWEFVG